MANRANLPMTRKAEAAFIHAATFTLGALSAAIGIAEALHRYHQWIAKGETLPVSGTAGGKVRRTK